VGLAAVVVAAIAIPLAVGGSTHRAPVERSGPTTPPLRPTPTAAVTPPLSAHQQMLHDYPQRCGGRYDRWNLIKAVTASAPAGGVVQLVGHPGYVRCGGPSDIAYLHHRADETLTLAPGAVVRIVDVESTHGATRHLDPTQLRAYVLRHAWSNFYRYVGPPDAITRLIELYHP
jgi:hypothetical protein